MEIPTKAQLRKEFLAKRESLDPAERQRSSSLIRQRLFQHPSWKNAVTILCYVSFGSEVETHTLIQEALRFKKKVAVPLIGATRDDVTISELQRFGELEPGPNPAVLQPSNAFFRPVDPATVDLALIPGSVFDLQGGRIGFGGGYFDRLLAKMPKAFRMGLGFSVQVTASPLPMESHDVRLQAIATEKEILIPKGL